ncbi:MAG: polyribonucleotide nucleotidyltransferase [Desulfurella sp.]|uniref:polyribonucleotide nucleotidyltransferase n=1 Tax=Desulfurella sp. TaxID=1962857 RepID=UPI000CAC7FE1|nr:polyribonucleotide nucleotidyltransferase [Desulfurella sp.]PMP92118.1 MAG: polyribonucleotide nucleotidyltransferase [Desulfurella sp.]HEX13883.1 polyribonucleotide nucleotidyltransferase [Desulfurella acetivorans]
MIFEVQDNIYGKKISIQTGKWAKQADGACVVSIGDTVVLATVVSTKEPPKEFLDFFPLTVNYQEKFYAIGKIPGGFVKREGKPSDYETLVSRLIDRSIRPLFPSDYKQETQVIVTTISADQENDIVVASVLAASCAINISDIPFFGPCAACRIGLRGKEFIPLPTQSELKDSPLNLIVAGTKNAINMIESGSNEITTQTMVESISYAQKVINKLIDLQEKIIKDAAKPKRQYEPMTVSDKIMTAMEALCIDELQQALNIIDKKTRHEKIDSIFKAALEKLSEEFSEEENFEAKLKAAFEGIIKNLVRDKIISTGIRIDGRGLDDIRPITCEVGILPRTHGSAVFTRGETQALVVTTLGSKSDMQIIDNIGGETFERFMLHYNFPPFCVGEVRRLGAPGRREIGHGALAKRAIEPVIPDEADFPYAIRIVSDILESNGSSSMATVCGATLSLMDAGVPIKKPVSGVAMGLIKSEDNYYILTDIMGDEDHYGDMDFKVAGTKDGINALQMDIKIEGVNDQLLMFALEKAEKARLFILDKMLETLPTYRSQLSEYAPKVTVINISADKIKDLIGPGGKVIKSIIEETNTKIDIEQDGRVNIFASNTKDLERAIQLIKISIGELEEGQIVEGVVSRIEDYGAFVKFSPNQEGLMHISQIDTKRVKSVSDVLSVGDRVTTKIIGIDKFGRISLSLKALKLENQENQEEDNKNEASDT